jgi:peptidoglycan LD-endopeptidase LytH
MERPSGDRWDRWLAGALVVAVTVAGLGATTLRPGPVFAAPAETPGAAAPAAASDGEDGDEAPEDEEEPAPSPEELAHERALEELAVARRTLAAAEASLRGARSASGGSDGALRRGEEALVPAILGNLDAEAQLAAAERTRQAIERRIERTEARLVALAEREVAVTAELEVARIQLEERVIRAYKTGSLAYESSLPLTVIREAGSPSELATAIKHLATLMAVGLDEVEALVDELLAIEEETATAEAELEQARQALHEAHAAELDAAAANDLAAGEVTSGERRAAALRAAANDAEGRLLAAVARVHATQAALAASYEEALAAAAAAEEPPPDVEVDLDADDDQDAGWQGRERALARQRSLPAEDRATAADWLCPVDGARFINDWGFPRSNQRRHEGTDVFAPLGTPVVAPTDAVVEKLDAVDAFDGRRDLGGITVWLERDRHRFYLAHLDAIHPDLAVGDEVRAGTVIGWVGRSGNARGTPPHLHLGWYVDQVAVNPYASLAVACSPDRPPHPAEPASGGSDDAGS